MAKLHLQNTEIIHCSQFVVHPYLIKFTGSYRQYQVVALFRPIWAIISAVQPCSDYYSSNASNA